MTRAHTDITFAVGSPSSTNRAVDITGKSSYRTACRVSLALTARNSIFGNARFHDVLTIGGGSQTPNNRHNVTARHRLHTNMRCDWLTAAAAVLLS